MQYNVASLLLNGLYNLPYLLQNKRKKKKKKMMMMMMMRRRSVA